ncbi:NAC domain-containing protein [Vigna angularis]|uniref:NAC domain-containing protein n=3 Tax=Phaseolus angularis TaxID=3914 RepID=A0A8T0JTV4_PHAAN|nr:NAC domain-containing protein 100 [Vigna angularis]KAG2384048.1 NAC domain-containing protein [Vigna angularis]BAU01275.1 hypothetical protein VIGAN_11047700 [Vigna angularis var. angularis]
MDAMENYYYSQRDTMAEEAFDLPPGFRFHPTDEELITHYLSQKVLDNCFCSRAIGEADLNKCEPWDLPCMAKMGEKEWYFFSVRDRKYPTGQRTNRATGAGYWKATGKDKEIYKAKKLIGMKKTLVFYKGRAPSGEKTNWVMHEYRLEDDHSMHNPHKKAMNDWAICRIFEKTNCGKKMQISGLVRLSSFGKEMPSLMDSSQYNTSEAKPVLGESSHLSSDRNQSDENIAESLETLMMASSSSYSSNPFDVSPASWSVPHQSLQAGNSNYSMDEEQQSMLGMLIENHGSSTTLRTHKALDNDFDADTSSLIYNDEIFHRSFGNQEYSSPSLWGF